MSLENELRRLRLLPKTTGDEGSELKASWQVYRRKLRDLVASGGSIWVRNQLLEPLVEHLGYSQLEAADNVITWEGAEPGGLVMLDGTGARLRVWSTNYRQCLETQSHGARLLVFIRKFWQEELNRTMYLMENGLRQQSHHQEIHRGQET